MPLPDASKKSPRVYTNLQNLDLDSVTFTNIQDTGNPIAVEEMNEDEMRRLVLVNLARLVTAGEWTGLLEAGGGAYNVTFLEDVISSTYARHLVTAQPPFGGITLSTLTIYAATDPYDNPRFIPFIAPQTGDITEVGINVVNTGSTNFLVGFYTTTDTGGPGSLLGYATLDCTSSGVVYDTSLSATVALEKGTQYYIGSVRDSSGVQIGVTGVNNTYIGTNWLVDSPVLAAQSMQILQLTGSDAALPASVTLSNCETYGAYAQIPPRVTLKIG